MKFSVLISVYYKENPGFLDNALSSIWDTQTHKPDEIILVKDGQLTPELNHCIENWKIKLNNHLNVIPLQHNVGLGKALNEGLKHCQYEWIMRMDTDDISASDRFEKQISYIRSHPDVALLSGQIEEFEGDINNIVSKREVPLIQKDILKYARSRSPFNHATIAMKKSIVQATGGYQHHLLMEDYNLWLRILSQNYQVANLPDTLLYVRSDGMHGRRRGWNYVKSEWQLFQLKRELKFQPTISAFIFFIARALPRLLPASALQFLYKILRK